MNVLFLPEVREYFDELEIILYQKGYFDYEDSAHQYVDELVYGIKADLSKLPHKPAPPYFDKYGKNMSYAAFRKNRQTTWYVFFTQYSQDGDTIYLIQYIANNHTVAQFLESC